MPWHQTDPVKQRELFVKETRRSRVSFTELCELFGVSRKTGYKWLKRAELEGLTGLEDRSRRPHSNARAVQPAMIERLIRLRRKHPLWGGRKLLEWLRQNEPHWSLPAASTVTELLKREGLVKPRKRRGSRIPRTQPLAHAKHPNDVWTIDFKGDFKLGDGSRCYPLTVTDAVSRAGLCCRGQATLANLPTQKSLTRTFREWGLPLRIRSDNGNPFGTSCTGPLSRFSIWLIKLGIRPEFIAPAHPEQNARHERFHRTLKEHCCIPPSSSLQAQQRRFNSFLREYNDERPHEALGGKTPASVHTPSNRRFPSRIEEPTYPSHYELRRIPKNGGLLWKKTRYYLTEALHGETVGLSQTSPGNWEIYFGPVLVGRLHEALPEIGLIKPTRLLPMSPV